jgi:maltose alpha-D-glucosyltransferase/alpha-amylase
MDLVDTVPVTTGEHALELVIVAVASGPNEATSYVLPLSIESSSGDASECSALPGFWSELIRRLMSESEGIPSRSGRRLILRPGSRFERLRSFGSSSTVDVHSGEQSNTSVALGTDVFLKLFRKVEPGTNPDAEIAACLSRQATFTATPQLIATIELVGDGSSRCLALLTERIDAQGDAWTKTLHELARYWDCVADCDQRESPELLGTFPSDVEQLGRRTAELHAALASNESDPAFAPEPFTQTQLNQLMSTVSDELSMTCRLLENAQLASTDARVLATRIGTAGRHELERLSELKLTGDEVQQIRCHGDYHLGQVLWTGSDWMIIDFEGESDRPLRERREKRCALKDVASMMRSFHYASCAGSVGLIAPPDESIDNPRRWQSLWYRNCIGAFLRGYRVDSQPRRFLPRDENLWTQWLDLFQLEKVLYELRYELQNRPDWLAIPLSGLREVLHLDLES